MKIAISLDTQAVITQPTPVRVKAASFVAVEISFTRGSQPVRLPDGAVLEFALKPQGEFTGDLLVYHNVFTTAAGVHYAGTVNFATGALLAALGLGDTDPGNDETQLEASGEITWSIGSQKFRSATFPVIVEPPLTDDNPIPTPDPQLYPAPNAIALKSDIPTPPDLTPYVLKTDIDPDPGFAANSDIKIPSQKAVKTALDNASATATASSNAARVADHVVSNRFNADHTGWKLGDIVKQTGNSLPRIAQITFPADFASDQNYGMVFWDEGSYTSYCDVTGLSKNDAASALASAINAGGLNVTASAAGNVVTVTSNTIGALPTSGGFYGNGAWALIDGNTDISPGYATLAIMQADQDGVPPGTFLVVDIDHLGDAGGYKGIGDTVDFLSGFGQPANSIGEEGNGYVDLNNGDFYHRSQSGWAFVLNIIGPQGPSGQQGDPGAQGPAGITGMSFARKLANTAINSTTTLADDPDLQIAVSQTGIYKFHAFLNFLPANGAMGIKVKMSCLFDQDNFIFNTMEAPYASNVTFKGMAGTLLANTTIGAAGGVIEFYGFVSVSGFSTGNTMRIQWAQNTNNSANLSLQKGSYLILQRL